MQPTLYTMKTLITLIIGAIPSLVFGQLGIDYNQPNLPFTSVSYEIKERFRPELRIGTDNFLEDISLEGIVSYDILNKEEYEFYGGLGYRTINFDGLVIPIGFNFYPLASKNFGFKIEVTPILGESTVLRGSLGFRYRFRNTNGD
jgi:hypothetical protein